MAISRNPKRLRSASAERRAEAFISGVQQETGDGRDENKQPVMIRIDPALLKLVDRRAKKLGISRSAFIVQSAAEKLERDTES